MPPKNKTGWIRALIIAGILSVLGYFFIHIVTAENRFTKVEARLDSQQAVLVDIQDNVKWLTRDRPPKKWDGE